MIACGYDQGYAPPLGQFAGDKESAERMTLLRGGRQFPGAIRDLGLKSTHFADLFNEVAQPMVSSGPVVSAGGVSDYTVCDTDMTNGGDNGKTSDYVPSGVPAERVKLSRESYNPQAQWHRLGPLQFDEDGCRVDKPLHYDESTVKRIRKGRLCYWFYLRGRCHNTGGCSHLYRVLSDSEFDALWWLARQGRCRASEKADENGGKDCEDPLCVYGHRRGSEAN